MKVKNSHCRIPEIGSFQFLCPVLEDLTTEEFILASKIMNISLDDLKSLFNRQIEMYLNLQTRQNERNSYAKASKTIIRVDVSSPISGIAVKDNKDKS